MLLGLSSSLKEGALSGVRISQKNRRAAVIRDKYL